MNRRTCGNCENKTEYYDGVSYDMCCEKHKKWVYYDETCDDWEEEQ